MQNRTYFFHGDHSHLSQKSQMHTDLHVWNCLLPQLTQGGHDLLQGAKLHDGSVLAEPILLTTDQLRPLGQDGVDSHRRRGCSESSHPHLPSTVSATHTLNFTPVFLRNTLFTFLRLHGQRSLSEINWCFYYQTSLSFHCLQDRLGGNLSSSSSTPVMSGSSGCDFSAL